MKNKVLIYFVLLISLVGNLKVHSQAIFDEKLGECNIEKFIVESNSAKVEIEGKDLLTILAENWDDKIANKIRGILSLQILVNTQGTSCLLSLENDTNFESSVLNLGQMLQENLKWQCPTENISVIYSINFYDGEVDIKRVGMDSKKGFVVID